MNRLDMNNSGSWKAVLRFDYADDALAQSVRNAAEALSLLSAGDGGRPRIAWRISRDEPQPRVVERWTVEQKRWVKE